MPAAPQIQEAEDVLQQLFRKLQQRRHGHHRKQSHAVTEKIRRYCFREVSNCIPRGAAAACSSSGMDDTALNANLLFRLWRVRRTLMQVRRRPAWWAEAGWGEGTGGGAKPAAWHGWEAPRNLHATGSCFG
jgi:hypothetical protein